MSKIADAFNAWMDDYVHDPEAFNGTTVSALHHVREKLDGQEPSYGAQCAAILQSYMDKAQQDTNATVG
jgi:hypothetical protein